MIYIVLLTLLYAQEPCSDRSRQDQTIRQTANLSVTDWAYIEGEELQILRQGRWVPVKKTTTLQDGDRVKSANKARLTAKGQIISFPQDFEFQIKFNSKKQPILEHLMGFLHWVTRGCDRGDCPGPQVQTPTAAIGVRGTEYFLEIRKTQETISVLHGEVRIKMGSEEFSVRAGESLKIGRSPVTPTTVEELAKLPR